MITHILIKHMYYMQVSVITYTHARALADARTFRQEDKAAPKEKAAPKDKAAPKEKAAPKDKAAPKASQFGV